MMGPIYGGTTVLISGVGFGALDTQPIAFIGDRPCQFTIWVSATQMKCVLPPQAAPGSYKVHVVVLDGTSPTEGSPEFIYSGT